MEEKEIWKDVPGYEGYYQVSSLGMVKRLERERLDKRVVGNIKEHFIKPWYDPAGYPMVTLHACGKRTKERIHRLVAKCFIEEFYDGCVVDHKDRVKSNNDIKNIRVGSHFTNATNKEKISGLTSKFKGVYKHSKTGKWVSIISCNGNRYSLGCFDIEEEAADAYDKKALELHGEYACTNEMLGLYE
jgi:hypothetical protein